LLSQISIYNEWDKYRRAKEAESALANMESNKPQRYEAEVPPSGSRGSNSPDEIIVLVDEEGRLKLNSQEVGTTSDTSQLRAQLEQYFRERRGHYPARTVFIKASCKIPYTEITKVVDVAKGAGADSVGLEVANPK
jgi:biopolymer transport protein ExbD